MTFSRRCRFLFTLAAVFLGGAVATSARALPHDPFTVILVDKSKNQILISDYSGERIEVRKSHHATLGKALGDKLVEKDLKTPEGIYFFTSKLTPPSLKKKFGVMALMMNYPNPLDQKAGKTGYDIMLHATDDPHRLTKDLDSEGCVVVGNTEIEEIARHIRLGLTPIIIYPELKQEYLSAAAKPAVKQAFERWLGAWKGKDLDTYIGSYAKDFVYGGMDLRRYREHKRSLNERYAEIGVRADNVRYFLHPKYDAVYFTQRYESKLKNGARGFTSSGTKVLYFVADGDSYKISSETYSPVKED